MRTWNTLITLMAAKVPKGKHRDMAVKRLRVMHMAGLLNKRAMEDALFPKEKKNGTSSN